MAKQSRSNPGSEHLDERNAQDPDGPRDRAEFSHPGAPRPTDPARLAMRRLAQDENTIRARRARSPVQRPNDRDQSTAPGGQQRPVTGLSGGSGAHQRPLHQSR